MLFLYNPFFTFLIYFLIILLTSQFVDSYHRVTMKKDTNTKNLIKWLWSSSKGARKQAVVNTLIGILDVACQLLWVLACKHAIDIATGMEQGSLVVTGIVIGLLMLIEITSRGVSRWIHAVIGNKVRNKMRLKIFARLLRGEWMGLQKHHTGDLTNRLEGDVNSITALITEIIPATFVVMIQLVASFFLLFHMLLLLLYLLLQYVLVRQL